MKSKPIRLWANLRTKVIHDQSAEHACSSRRVKKSHIARRHVPGTWLDVRNPTFRLCLRCFPEAKPLSTFTEQ